MCFGSPWNRRRAELGLSLFHPTEAEFRLTFLLASP